LPPPRERAADGAVLEHLGNLFLKHFQRIAFISESET
jgi:hypothetical protein